MIRPPIHGVNCGKKKKQRVAKNKKQQLRNLQNAQGPRLPGTIDLTSALPHKKSKSGKQEQSKKTHVDVALGVAQVSTASLGKFDKTRRKEPTRPKYKVKPSREPTKISNEKEQNLEVLSKILHRNQNSNTVPIAAAHGKKAESSKKKRDPRMREVDMEKAVNQAVKMPKKERKNNPGGKKGKKGSKPSKGKRKPGKKTKK